MWNALCCLPDGTSPFCNDDGFHTAISDFAMCMQTRVTRQSGKDDEWINNAYYSNLKLLCMAHD